jgi:signal transduction histidine kinase
MTQKTSPRPDAHQDIRAGRKTFIATVVTVYVTAFVFPQQPFTPGEIIRLIAVGGLYVLLGLAVIETYTRTGARLALVVFYALEIPLAGFIVYETAGFFLAGLIMLPLAGLSVQVLPRRWMLTVSALLVIALGLSYGLRGGWEAALLASAGYLTAIVFVILITQTAVREREARAEAEAMAAELAEANRQLKYYAAQAEELVITRERARLAHEIHDSVGHTLTALDVQLALLAHLPQDQVEQRRQITEQAKTLVKAGLTDVRRAVRAMRPAALETFSLPEAIPALVADFEQSAHFHIVQRVDGEALPLPPRLALPLYRAAQEALTNVRRHAPAARQVTVRLEYSAETVSLTVENDGVSQTSEASEDLGDLQEGYGLRGLRERAESLGGTFSAGPDGVGNFRLELRLPLN